MTARPAPSGDAGAGTVLALAVLSVVMFGAVAVAATGEATVVRHRAAAAADAAALAGALAAAAGSARPCAQAARVAVAAGAAVVDCHAQGPTVDVRVEVHPPAWLQWAGTARLNARAGPAET